MKTMLFLFNGPAMQLRQALISDLSKRDYHCCVALPMEDIPSWKNKYPQIHFVSFESFSGTAIGLLNNLMTFFNIRKLIKTIKPDIVFLGNVKPNIYGGLAAHWCKVKNIYGLVSGLGYAFIEEPSLKRSIIRKICIFLYKLSFKRFNHIFFQNHDDRNLFIQKHIVREDKSSVVAGTGVDLELFQPKVFPQQLTFFMAARLIKEKGVFHFVEAARILKTKYPAVRFILGGNIDTNPSAITQQQLEEISNFVEYIGYVEDMPKVMQRCSVFVYPSYYREGVPRALLEALACGRPVITTDNIGCREVVIDNANGFKIAIKSTEALMNAMEEFIKNPELLQAFGKESRKLAENKFDIHFVNKQIHDVIATTLK